MAVETGLEEAVQIAQITVGVFVILGVLFGAVQLVLARRARNAQVIATVLETLQTREARSDRRALHQVKDTPLAGWTDEQRESVDQVCQAFNTVAFMATKKLVPKQLVLDNWRRSMSTCWDAAQPLIVVRRKNENNPLLWQHFETLAGEAKEQLAGRANR